MAVFNDEKNFTWDIIIAINRLSCVSDYFKFCGHFCYLCVRTDKNPLVTLKVPPSLLKNNISCRYSLDLKLTNFGGTNRFHRTAGEIQIAESTLITIYEGEIVSLVSGCLKFSWIENGDYNMPRQEQGVQRGHGMPSSCIECATQTADIQFLHLEDIRSNVESSSLTIERATQTDSAQPSPASSICSCKERGSNKFLELLSKDLSNFYDNETDPDCVLKVDDTKFRAHRSVLSSRSTVFAAMFHHDTFESQSGEVNILDVDAGALGDVLYYIYAGKVRGLSPETAASMYNVSDKYALVDLREECLNFLTNNLTMENVCDAALLAHRHSETDLENSVLQFIEERLEELVQNDNWKKFSDTHFKLSNYLLSSAFVASKTKMIKRTSNLQNHFV